MAQSPFNNMQKAMSAGRQGFTLIELIIAVALVAIFIPAIMKGLSFSFTESRQGEQYSQAWAIARQGMEQVFDQKTSWSWTATSPINGTSAPETINTSFTRSKTIASAYRCAGSLCTSSDAGAVEDLTTRYITVTVNWLTNGQSEDVVLNAYVTQH